MLLDGIGHAVAAYDRRVIVARMAAGRHAKAQLDPRSESDGFARDQRDGLNWDHLVAG